MDLVDLDSPVRHDGRRIIFTTPPDPGSRSKKMDSSEMTLNYRREEEGTTDNPPPRELPFRKPQNPISESRATRTT